MIKKILIFILLYLSIAFPVHAATYFGCASQEITAAGTFEDAAGCDGTALTWASLANGDILVANGQTISIANDVGNGAVTVTLTTEGTDYGGTDGGGYTFNINTTTAKTLYTNITAGSTNCLTITGIGAAGTELTIIGNITGGNAGTASGVSDTHTTAGAIVAITGNCTGGSAGSTNVGYTFLNNSNASITNITGDCLSSGAASGCSNAGTTGIINLTGNCTASDSGYYEGCYAINTGPINVTGSLVSSLRGSPHRGTVRWSPVAPASGVTGNYFKTDGGGTAVYVGGNTDDASKALSTFFYIDPTDGTSDQGAATSSGGHGAWLN